VCVCVCVCVYVCVCVCLLSKPLHSNFLVPSLWNWTSSDIQNLKWQYCSCNRVLQHLEVEKTIRHTSVQSPLSCSNRPPSIDKQWGCCCRCYSNITKTAAILQLTLSSQPVPDSGKQIKASFMTRRCCSIKTLSHFLLTFKERENRTARSSPKFVYPQIFYPGCWQSILTPKCRRRIYRARNGKDNKWTHIMLKYEVIEKVMFYSNK